MKRFAVIGAGWRAEYFLRVACSHPEEFEITGVLCRSEEKANKIQEKFGVKTAFTEEEIVAEKPDFIVVSVSKNASYKIAKHWKDKGFVVINETPVAFTKDEVADAFASMEGPGQMLVAEQYIYYPTYKKILDEIKVGKIGEVTMTNLSICHDYHGFSVMRHVLGEKWDAAFRMRTQRYQLPVTKTGDRFNVYRDGEIVTTYRNVVTVEYEDGKIGIYDFDSDQYHSTIRHNSMKVTGTRGEIIDGIMYYLDDQNIQQKAILSNNFQYAREEKSDDEAAVYYLMNQAYLISQGDVKAAEWGKDNLLNGLVDAQMTIFMNESSDWVCYPK